MSREPLSDRERTPLRHGEKSASKDSPGRDRTRVGRSFRIDELPDDTSWSARSRILISYPHAYTSRATRTTVLSFRLSSPKVLLLDATIPRLLMS